MGIMQPTLKIEILDSLAGEDKDKRDLAIKNNLYEIKFKDEAGQTNDILTLSLLDDGSFDKLEPKTKISLLVGYVIPKTTDKPKDLNSLTKVADNATKIKEFIANQARGVAYKTVGKYVPNFLVSSVSGKFTGQLPNDDTTREVDDRESILYSLGTFSVNKLTKTKDTNKRTLEIECLTISTIFSMASSRTRNFKGSTLEDVAATIAAESGLNLSIHSNVADAPIDLAQTQESNQAFLRKLCDNNNAAFKVTGDTLFINHRDSDTKVNGSPLPEIELDENEDIISYSYIVDSGKALTGIIGYYKDPDGGADISFFLGDRTGYTRNNGFVYASEETAKREVQAQLDRGNSSNKAFQMVTDGSKLLVPDSKFVIRSTMDSLLDGHRFKVTSANYTFTAGRLRVSYNCEKA